MATNSKNFKIKNSIEVNGNSAIGGNVNLYDSSGYIELKTNNGPFYRVTIENDGSLSTEIVSLEIEYLVIAGGGGGGAGNVFDGRGAGGGGAGGYRCNVPGENSGSGTDAEPGFTINAGIPYVITVGAGGTGSFNWGFSAVSGSNSVLGSISSSGGGRGGSSGPLNGASGGSGGGGGSANTDIGSGGAGTSGQGSAGGIGRAVNNSTNAAGGGGGGAGSSGENGDVGIGGAGGAGLSSNISGTSVARGGGGGGGAIAGGTATAGGGTGARTGSAGQTNSGGGGGGNQGGGGGNGGSGVVIFKYPDTFTATFSAGVTQSTSTSGGFKVSTITATSTTSETVTFA